MAWIWSAGNGQTAGTWVNTSGDPYDPTTYMTDEQFRAMQQGAQGQGLNRFISTAEVTGMGGAGGTSGLDLGGGVEVFGGMNYLNGQMIQRPTAEMLQAGARPLLEELIRGAQGGGLIGTGELLRTLHANGYFQQFSDYTPELGERITEVIRLAEHANETGEREAQTQALSVLAAPAISAGISEVVGALSATPDASVITGPYGGFDNAAIANATGLAGDATSLVGPFGGLDNNAILNATGLGGDATSLVDPYGGFDQTAFGGDPVNVGFDPGGELYNPYDPASQGFDPGSFDPGGELFNPYDPTATGFDPGTFDPGGIDPTVATTTGGITGNEVIDDLLGGVGDDILDKIIDTGKDLLPSWDTTAALAPILAAINYAKNQGSFDTTRLVDTYNAFDPTALTREFDSNSALGKSALTSSLTNRKVMGSSFGNMDLANFDTTRDLGRRDIINRGVLARGGVAKDILNAEVEERKLKNQLYGQSLLAIGNVFGGRKP